MQIKLNTQIFIHNEHFMCLIFVGCHGPQKYFKKKNLHVKTSHSKSPNYGILQIQFSSFHIQKHLDTRVSSAKTFDTNTASKTNFYAKS